MLHAVKRKTYDLLLCMMKIRHQRKATSKSLHERQKAAGKYRAEGNMCNFPDAQERVAEEASPSPHNPEPRTPNAVLRMFLNDMNRFSIKFQTEEEKE